MPPANKRRTIYVGAPIERLLSLLGDDSGGFSQAINGAVARYLEIVREHRPAFSRAEWCAICDALNGTILDDAWLRNGGSLIAAEIEDCVGLGEKWDVDAKSLCSRIAALSTADALAVLHVVEVFWANSHLDTAESLALAGIE